MLRLEEDFDRAVLLFLEDFVPTRPLFQRQPVRRKALDPEWVAVGEERHDVIYPVLDVGLSHPDSRLREG